MVEHIGFDPRAPDSPDEKKNTNETEALDRNAFPTFAASSCKPVRIQSRTEPSHIEHATTERRSNKQNVFYVSRTPYDKLGSRPKVLMPRHSFRQRFAACVPLTAQHAVLAALG